VDNSPARDDEALLEELRAEARAHDDVPEAVLHAARAAYTWRTVDEELAALAELTFDSAAGGAALAGVRGTVADARVLSFEQGASALELECARDRNGVDVSGQVVPVGVADVVVESADDSAPVHAQSDANGLFRVRVETTSAIRLRVTTAGGDTLRTEWISP
jgi:hypothetical protein